MGPIPPVHGRRQRRTRRRPVPIAFLLVGVGVAFVPAAAGGTAPLAPLYAYPNGIATDPTTCPLTSVTTSECSLTEALALVEPGGTVDLTSPNSRPPVFVGNYGIDTSGAPVTIKPRVANAAVGGENEGAYLDGNYGVGDGCTTEVGCNGSILTVGASSDVDVSGVTFENARSDGDGGAVTNDGALQCSCDFSFNLSLGDGGAVDNTGTFSDRGTFTGNFAATDGGAIYSTGSLIENYAAFRNNDALGDGGAIDAPSSTGGEFDLLSSTFSGNVASGMGGALNIGDGGDDRATIAVDDFADNTASAGGGAVQIGPAGAESVTVSRSTFVGNDATGMTAGGAILDNSTAPTVVEDSSFSSNVGYLAGAISNNASGSLTIVSSTFSSNASSPNGGGTVAGRFASDTVIAADILAGASGGGTECSGGIEDGGYNVSDDDSCHFDGQHSINDSSTIDGDLVALSSNDYPRAINAPGPTPSIALVPTAVSIANDPAFENIPFTFDIPGTLDPLCSADDTDQRFAPRPAPCDAGAFELFGTRTSLKIAPWHVTSHATRVITFTVTMWSQDQPAPHTPVVTGTVDIRIGSRLACRIANVLTHPACTVPVASVPAGTHHVTADFLGSTNYAASTSAATSLVVS